MKKRVDKSQSNCNAITIKEEDFLIWRLCTYSSKCRRTPFRLFSSAGEVKNSQIGRKTF